MIDITSENRGLLFPEPSAVEKFLGEKIAMKT